ncbi:hypothetical protein CUMW_225970 [Citrus unshiu]|uniref:non-specific serine/threonine protein kinase n=1 Tax=Citrus unshiu TaxID=55188 RepID=A0A2H5QFR5_CITUN|nr:hypothetical protein CUMW_225970 [Citrus unshiu]GAY63479.1 hypothetical protein CUMW_225970 [Citrus unshiu]
MEKRVLVFYLVWTIVLVALPMISANAEDQVGREFVLPQLAGEEVLMLCIFLSRSYKILPIVCRVGIICLGICARGFTLLVTLKAVLQECEQLHLLISFLIFIRVLQSSSNLFVYLISDLGNAALSGELAPELGQLKNLELLELYGNNLSGHIPSALGNLIKLKSLDLYSNLFNGTIPDTLANLKQLKYLRLNNNSLSGLIPTSLTTITSLNILDLSNNRLSGPVPDNGSFSQFTPISFENNLNLCGPNTKKPCSGSPPFSPPPPFGPTSSPGRNKSNAAIPVGVALGAALLFAVPVIGFAYWRRTRPHEFFFDVPAEDDSELQLGQLKRFSLRELQVATDGFSNKNILGRGGFGKVYKGRLADGKLVAVKRLKEERTSGGELQFQTEVKIISMAVHRNLLGLCGFCTTVTEKLLVYRYMANGSVASRLRERQSSLPPLDWPTRKKIALGSARGLSYLHEHCDPKIIHRDVKAANILLDEEFEAVVGDFGLAKLMDYKDTHRAFDLAMLANDEDVMLLDRVKGYLREKKFDVLVDKDLQTDYDETEVEELIQVALLCTQSTPVDRPTMSEVVKMLEGDGLAERWGQWQTAEVIRHNELQFGPRQNFEKIVYSTDNLSNMHLSGPR